MDKITTLIIDDEQKGIDALVKDLSEYHFIEVIGTTTSPIQGRDMVKKFQPDLLFIDVEMPELSGIDLVKEVQPSLHAGISIVFYSAFDKYMLDALRISAFDYLLKPYLPEELDAVLQRVKEGQKINPRVLWASLSSLLAESQKFAVQTVTNTMMLYPSDVVFFVFSKECRCWQVMLSGRKMISLKKNTTSKDLICLGKSFIQVSADCIINTKYLVSIENKTLSCALCPPYNGIELYASRRCYAKIREGLNFI